MDAPVFFAFQPDLGGLLSLVITFVLPVLVGLVTKRSTHAGVKAVLLLALAYASAGIQAWVIAPNLNWVVIVYNGAINFVIAVAIHFGLWRPTTVAGVAQDSLNKG
jgi:hypothetical protein